MFVCLLCKLKNLVNCSQHLHTGARPPLSDIGYFLFLYFIRTFILLSRESDQCAVRARLEVAGHLSTTLRWGIPFSLFQGHNKRTCRLAPHYPFDAERQAGKLRIPIFSSSDGVEYSTSEYEYRKKIRVRVQVLILKNVLEYQYRKKVRARVLLQM